MTKPYWFDEGERSTLPQGNVQEHVDVAIIGGGVTGCLCALALAQAGVHVRVHEAREVGSGASGRNAGFALRGAAVPYHLVREQLGEESALRLWRSTEQGLRDIAAIAGDSFTAMGSLQLAASHSECDDLRREYEALTGDGFAVDWIDNPLGSSAGYPAGLHHPTDGSLHPGRWLSRLADAAAHAGAEFCEQDRVGDLSVLDAEHIVIATDGYGGGLHPWLDSVVRPVRNHVLASEPLEARLFERPHYARYGFDYWQQTPDGHLIIGGCRDQDPFPDLTDDEDLNPGVLTALEQLAENLLGYTPIFSHCWTGIFGVTEDHLPVVGRIPESESTWTASGYSGHGNVLGFMCGKAIAEAILDCRGGGDGALSEVFTPFRPERFA